MFVKHDNSQEQIDLKFEYLIILIYFNLFHIFLLFNTIIIYS
jgi:hypothetical protein